MLVDRCVCGEADESTELHVLAQALANSVGVVCDRRRVDIGGSGRWSQEGKRHAQRDVRFDVGELAQVRARLSAHAGDGVQPVPLLRRAVDERHGRDRAR